MKLASFCAAALLALAAPLLAAPAEAQGRKPAAAETRVVLPKTATPERYELRITPNPDKLTFDGQVRIALTVNRPTDRIVLNSADLTLKRASLSGRTEAPKIVFDTKVETASFVFAKPLTPGRYTLTIDYSGKIYQQASGLFALDYKGQNGADQRALFSQFQNSDARRFVPSWDEPGIKSVFALSVEAPADQMVVSNMPALAVTAVTGGRQLVRFADSPKMSSYLLFLAMGDFERISQKVGNTDVGVVVRRGDTEKARFALDSAVKLLPYFNDYFGTPYPLPKLDMIAGPGQSQVFGAMENWGAIFYFDYYLLLDPKLSTETDRQNVFVVVAHEMAHQWFGNLVTMEWWDDLWLNEGFASWMENKATDHFHPEWNMWLLTQDAQQRAMRLDARVGTHPIITPIPDVFAAATAFDNITYEKGQAVVRMLETYVGEEAFRQGVRNYMEKYAYKNTVTDQFWAELDRVSPKPISDIAHDFTLQAGVPLIRADEAPRGVRLTQGRFGVDAPSKQAQTWRTPVAVRTLDGQASWLGVVSAARPEMAPAPGSAPAVVNAGQTGYFRTAYSPALWSRLAPRFSALTPADQLGLIFDSRALGEAGYAPLTNFLELAAYAEPTADPVVLLTLAEQLSAMQEYYGAGPQRDAYRAFVRARLAPVFARVGWEKKAGEPDNQAVLRAALVRILGSVRDPAVVDESRRRFAAYLKDPNALTGSMRTAVLGVVARQADAAAWDQIHALARQSRDVTDQQRLYRLLGLAEDPALGRRALQLALSGEPPKTISPSIIAAVSERHPDEAFAFALANRQRVDEFLEPASRTSYYTGLADGSLDRAMLAKLADFAKTTPASSRGEIDKAAAAISARLSVIEQRLPEVDRWLAARR
jgi:aminopeptidase N